MTETRDSFKNAFLCKICLKILKQPMQLPCDCGENVCEEHLNKFETPNRSITCQACHKCYDIRLIEFLKNTQLASQIESYSHLPHAAYRTKIETENLFESLEILLNEMKPKISELNLAQSEHFFNIRTEIDIRRERVNEKAHRDSLANVNNLEKTQKISYDLIEMVNLAENDLKITVNDRIKSVLDKIDLSKEREIVHDFFRNIDLSEESLEEFKKKYETLKGDLTRIHKSIELTEIELRQKQLKINESNLHILSSRVKVFGTHG